MWSACILVMSLRLLNWRHGFLLSNGSVRLLYTIAQSNRWESGCSPLILWLVTKAVPLRYLSSRAGCQNRSLLGLHCADSGMSAVPSMLLQLSPR